MAAPPGAAMVRTPLAIRPPASEEELRERAAWLAGRTVRELAQALGVGLPSAGVRGKGKVGALVEQARGGTSGSAPAPDFPALGVELKTIPIDERGGVRESTFVCTISLADAERAEWATSVARAKLGHVLFVPIVIGARDPSERRIGTPMFWRPTRR